MIHFLKYLNIWSWISFYFLCFILALELEFKNTFHMLLGMVLKTQKRQIFLWSECNINSLNMFCKHIFCSFYWKDDHFLVIYWLLFCMVVKILNSPFISWCRKVYIKQSCCHISTGVRNSKHISVLNIENSKIWIKVFKNRFLKIIYQKLIYLSKCLMYPFPLTMCCEVSVLNPLRTLF